MKALHDGPPYPVIVDQPVGERILEVWTDPDIGTGTFLVLLTAPDGKTAPAPPSELQICVVPVAGHLPETCWPMRVDLDARPDATTLRYVGEVEFPEGGWWTTRLVLRDEASVHEARVDVEVTPPGLGRIDFAIYLFPFVALGLLFLAAAIKRRRLRRAATCSPAQAAPPAR
ncbi:MAG: hypothetical protein ACT4PU_06190 [Planctomycetota bacterium]